MNNFDVLENGCWQWNGPTCAGGRYGRVLGFKPMKMAHRYHYEIHKGEISPGLMICHTCDNGLCVNPDHLYAGTASDNSKDAWARSPNKLRDSPQDGENNGNAKLTRSKVEDIRRFYNENDTTYKDVADRFGIGKGHAYNIINRYVWK